jgi:hypothetical protein
MFRLCPPPFHPYADRSGLPRKAGKQAQWVGLCGISAVIALGVSALDWLGLFHPTEFDVSFFMGGFFLTIAVTALLDPINDLLNQQRELRSKLVDDLGTLKSQLARIEYELKYKHREKLHQTGRDLKD